jgi:hypothetical protein
MVKQPTMYIPAVGPYCLHASHWFAYLFRFRLLVMLAITAGTTTDFDMLGESSYHDFTTFQVRASNCEWLLEYLHWYCDIDQV